MRGRYLLGLSSADRQAAGVVTGGEVEVEVEVEIDAEPRVVAEPADFARSLDPDPAARAVYDRLSYSRKREHVLAIESAKKPETRRRLIDKVLAGQRSGGPNNGNSAKRSSCGLRPSEPPFPLERKTHAGAEDVIGEGAAVGIGGELGSFSGGAAPGEYRARGGRLETTASFVLAGGVRWRCPRRRGQLGTGLPARSCPGEGCPGAAAPAATVPAATACLPLPAPG